MRDMCTFERKCLWNDEDGGTSGEDEARAPAVGDSRMLSRSACALVVVDCLLRRVGRRVMLVEGDGVDDGGWVERRGRGCRRV